MAEQPDPYDMGTTRRDFLATSICGSAAFMLGCGEGNMAQARARRLPAPYGDARLVANVPFGRGGRRSGRDEGGNGSGTPGRPNEVVYGEGRSGRFRQDLQLLTEQTLITPTERFYIRSRCPDLIDISQPWKIRIGGKVRKPREISIDDIHARVGSMGVHLMECSGNGGSFGLLSAAEWTGVPLAPFLEEMGVEGLTNRILVSGFDDHSSDLPMQKPNIGASWVYTLDQLADSGAFLATGMNGEPLPRDHGYPVRLVIPGWYGCTCIKWLNEIRFVDEAEPATAHMREYAGRTHQETTHELAVDYAPAEIDLAAMAVRVERWDHEGKPIYQVVGVIWGGDKLTDDLMIRFEADGASVPVQSYSHVTNATWSLWSHIWQPSRSGRHDIQLQVENEGIRTRRLDSAYYSRRVEIEVV